MTITLPTPTITTPHSWHEPGRSRRVAYLISEPGPERTEVVIHIGHSKTRKAFYATVSQVQVKEGSGFSSESFMLFDGVSLEGQPVARFSAKALDAYTAKIVEAFPAMVASSEKLQAKFVPTTEEF